MSDEKASRPAGELGEGIRAALLERHTPAAVAVDAAGTIAYSHGPVDRFLTASDMLLGRALYDVLPPPLREPVRQALETLADKAQRGAVEDREGRAPTGGDVVRFRCESIDVGGKQLLLLTFFSDGRRASLRGKLRSQDEELEASRERLQSLNEQLRLRERQQRTIAQLGQAGLGTRELQTFLDNLCDSLRAALDCDYAKVLQFDEERERLDLVAGVGWKDGLVGAASVETDTRSQGGYTLRVEGAVLVEDGNIERRFVPPPLLVEHEVRSGISCMIEVGGKAWGVLGLHDRRVGHFTGEDLATVQAAANVAAATITQTERELRLARQSLLLSLAIGSANMGIWYYDTGSGRTEWDEQLRRMIGQERAPQQPAVTDFTSMIVPEDRERVEAALARSIEKGVPYDEEFRIVRPDGSRVWLVGQGERLIENGRIAMVGFNADITRRKEAEEQNRFMMRELDHRVKNILAIIVSIARTSGRSASSYEEFIGAFENRLGAMARTHSMLADQRWQGAKLATLIHEELAQSHQGENVQIEGPEVEVSPAAAQSLSMALHELTTNAIKHGSLSTPKGRLVIRWEVTREGECLDLVWQETGGPPVSEPAGRGFGSTVIERILGAQLQAKIELAYEAQGLRAHFLIPMRLLAKSEHQRVVPDKMAGKNVDLGPIAGSCILILDDEWMVAEHHAQIVLGAGAKVAGPVYTVESACRMIEREQIDLAIVDSDIAGETSEPVIKALEERGIPVLIVSGFGSRVKLPPLENANFLPKPVSPASMLSRVAAMLRGTRPKEGTDSA